MEFYQTSAVNALKNELKLCCNCKCHFAGPLSFECFFDANKV